MKTFVFISCAIFSIVAINGDETCTTCKNTHSSKLEAATDDAKCSGLVEYINCLEGTKKTPDCPLEGAEAIKINGITCTDKFDAPCTCQQTFWGTEGDCTVRIGALESCLKNINGKACDKSSNAAAVLTKAKSRCGSSTSTACTASTGCKATEVCKIENGKDPVCVPKPKIPECETACTTPSGPDTHCTALNAYVKCIEDQNIDKMCVPPTADIAKIKPNNDCKPQAPCLCQIDFLKADLNVATQPCKALKEYKGCLAKAESGAGCNAQTKKALEDKVANKIKTNKCTNSGNFVSPTSGLIFALLLMIFTM